VCYTDSRDDVEGVEKEEMARRDTTAMPTI
jgi:hypothetical protein